MANFDGILDGMRMPSLLAVCNSPPMCLDYRRSINDIGFANAECCSDVF
jgi:hypothetical protein